jgi:hypothetical protein
MNCACGASVNPRWPKCLACDRPLTLPETPSLALPPEAKARRFKVTLKSGGILLHSAPSGLTRREAIELSKDWGEVAECVPAVEGDRVPVQSPSSNAGDHRGVLAECALESSQAKGFLNAMPSVDDLMPQITLDDLKAIAP